MALGIPTPQFDTSDKLQEMMQQAQTVTEQPIPQPPQTESEEQGLGQKLIQALALITAMRGKRSKPLEAFMAMEIGKRNAKRQKMMDEMSRQRIEVQGKFADARQQNAQTGQFRAQYQIRNGTLVDLSDPTSPQFTKLPEGWDARVDANSGDVTFFNVDTQESKYVPRDKVEEFVQSGEIFKRTKKGNETTLEQTGMTDATRKRMNEIDARIEKYRADSTLAARKQTQAEAQKQGIKLSQIESNALTDTNDLIGAAQEIQDMFSGPDADVLKSYMGRDVGALFKRAVTSEKGTLFLPDAPPALVTLMNRLENMRDILTRDRTGAAVNNKELEFYESLLGGLTITPEALLTRLKTTQDGFTRHKGEILKTARLRSDLERGSKTITEDGEVVKGTSEKATPQSPNDIPDDAKFGATDEQIDQMTIDELRTYTEKGVVPERLRNQNKNQDEE